MIETILTEARGTSLFGLDEIIKNIYLDVHNEIKYQYDENVCIDDVYDDFNFENKNIQFKIDIYSIKFKLCDYFNCDDKIKNYKVTINVSDIIDKKFSDNFDLYKSILDDCNGYTDDDNMQIVLNLNSYNRYINPKSFFIICTHELQHVYTTQKHKNIQTSNYILNLSNAIQNYIQTLNISNVHKIVLTDLFYVLFDYNEVASYSSQFYGELMTTIKNKKYKTRLISDLLNNTDAQKLLSLLQDELEILEKIKEDELFLICEFITNYAKNYKTNNKFINNVNTLFNNNDSKKFKQLLIKIFKKNYYKLFNNINKIAKNYYMCESKYPYMHCDFTDNRMIFKNRKII